MNFWGVHDLDLVRIFLSWDAFLPEQEMVSSESLDHLTPVYLLVPDLETGDSIELIGRGEYKNLREDRKQRLDPLAQHREDFPVQGVIACEIEPPVRLHQLLHPRRRLEQAVRITSRATASAQAPQ